MLRGLSASRRITNQCLTWNTVNERINNTHFCCMFRMIRQCLEYLCSVVISTIGEKASKLEVYIDTFLHSEHHCNLCLYQMNNVHFKMLGIYISGKVKLALTLRIYADGIALDYHLFLYIRTTF